MSTNGIDEIFLRIFFFTWGTVPILWHLITSRLWSCGFSAMKLINISFVTSYTEEKEASSSIGNDRINQLSTFLGALFDCIVNFFNSECNSKFWIVELNILRFLSALNRALVLKSTFILCTVSSVNVLPQNSEIELNNSWMCFDSVFPFVIDIDWISWPKRLKRLRTRSIAEWSSLRLLSWCKHILTGKHAKAFAWNRVHTLAAKIVNIKASSNAFAFVIQEPQIEQFKDFDLLQERLGIETNNKRISLSLSSSMTSTIWSLTGSIKWPYYLMSNQIISKRMRHKIDKMTNAMMENGLYRFYENCAIYLEKLQVQMLFYGVEDDSRALTSSELKGPPIFCFCVLGFAWCIPLLEFIMHKLKIRSNARVGTR